MFSIISTTSQEIHVDQSFNTRGLVTLDSCFSLAEDIKSKGLIQPILLRYTEKSEAVPQQYALVCGYRRYIATFFINKSETITAILNTDITKENALLLNAQENLEREELTEQQKVCLVDRFMSYGYDIRGIATILNKPRQWVFNYWALGQMRKSVQEAVYTGQLSILEIIDLYNFSDLTDAEFDKEFEKRLKSQKSNLDQARKIISGRRRSRDYLESRRFALIESLLRKNNVKVPQCLKPIMEWTTGNHSSLKLAEELQELYPNGNWEALKRKHWKDLKKHDEE